MLGNVLRFYRIEPPVLLDHFLRFVTERYPAEDKKSHLYIMATKLIFWVSRQVGGAVIPYLARVENHLGNVCF